MVSSWARVLLSRRSGGAGRGPRSRIGSIQSARATPASSPARRNSSRLSSNSRKDPSKSRSAPATDAGEAGRAQAAAGALWRFWQQRGHLAEGRRWLEEVLAMPSGQAPTAARAKALAGAGGIAWC
jgi:hypothetical protein